MPLPNHMTKDPVQLHWTIEIFIYMCSEAFAAKNYFQPKPKHSKNLFKVILFKVILKVHLKHSKMSVLSFLCLLKINFFSLWNLWHSVHNLFTNSFLLWTLLFFNRMENTHIISDVVLPFKEFYFPLSKLYPEIKIFNFLSFSH